MALLACTLAQSMPDQRLNLSRHSLDQRQSYCDGGCLNHDVDMASQYLEYPVEFSCQARPSAKLWPASRDLFLALHLAIMVLSTVEGFDALSLLLLLD